MVLPAPTLAQDAQQSEAWIGEYKSKLEECSGKTADPPAEPGHEEAGAVEEPAAAAADVADPKVMRGSGPLLVTSCAACVMQRSEHVAALPAF